MNKEDYEQYWQKGGTYVMPVEVFYELFEDYECFKNDCKKYKEVIDKAIKKLEEGITFCKNDSQGIHDICNMAIRREQNVLDILKEVGKEVE